MLKIVGVHLIFTKCWNVNKVPRSSETGMKPKAMLMLLSKGPTQQIKFKCCLTTVNVFGFRGLLRGHCHCLLLFQSICDLFAT